MRLVSVLTQQVHLKTSRQIMMLSFHTTERERQGKGERTHLSVSKVKPAIHRSPPDCAINPIWQLVGGRNIQPCGCYSEKETLKKTLAVVCLDFINVFGSGQQWYFMHTVAVR